MNERLLRISEIIGNRKNGTVGIIPVGRTTWFEGVTSGRFPQPVFLPGVSTPFWKLSDIERLMAGGDA
jgi:prophage regulatory protein